MDSLNSAWVAGLIDGEGCIDLHRAKTSHNRPFYSVKVRVGMVHKPTVERLHQFFGGSLRPKTFQNEKWRPQWLWQIMGNQAIQFLKQIRPFLVTKAEEADLAISYENLRGVSKRTVSLELAESRAKLYKDLQVAKARSWS